MTEACVLVGLFSISEAPVMNPIDPKSTSTSNSTPANKAGEGDRQSTGWAKDKGGAVWSAPIQDATEAPAPKSAGRKKGKREDSDELPTAKAVEPGAEGSPDLAAAKFGADTTGASAPEAQSDRPTRVALLDTGIDRQALGWAHEELGHVNSYFGGGTGLISLLSGGLALGAGAGGGGGSTSQSGTSGGGTAIPLSLVAHDGLIKGASVYVDTVDGRVKIGTTDATGHLNLANNTLNGDLIVTGGTNIDTGLPNTMELRLVGGTGKTETVVVNPLTTLVAALFDKGDMLLTEAEAAVKHSFGIADSINLSTYDPLDASVAGTTQALKVQQAAVQVATLASSKELASDAFGNVAQYISDHPSELIDLSDVDVLADLYPDATTAQLRELGDVATNNAAVASAVSTTEVAAIQLAGTAPVILGLLNDTGASATDKVTSDPRLIVTGQNSQSTVQYTVDGGAHWTSEVAPPANGPVSVQARLQYANGLTSEPSDVFTFSFSSKVPPPLTLALHTDTGTSAIDHVTAVGAIDVGNQAAGTFIEYSSDNQRTWSSTFSASKDGLYDVYARQTYIGATSVQASAPAHLSFKLDTASKAGTAGLAANTDDMLYDTGFDDDTTRIEQSYSDGVTSNKLPMLSGQTEAGATGVSVKIASVTYEVPHDHISADGSWTLQLTTALADGTYKPIVTVVDQAGNVSAPTEMAAITVDNESPLEGAGGLFTSDTDSLTSDSGLDGSDGITNVVRPTLAGTAEANSYVLVSINDVVYRTLADPQGHWTLTVTDPLADDEYVPTITVVDAAGNMTESDGQTIVIDTAPPEVITQAHLLDEEEVDTGVNSDDGITSNNLPTITGAVEDGTSVLVILNGKRYTYQAEDGDWSISVAEGDELDDGTYKASVLYVDDAGNVLQQKSLAFTIDTEAAELDEYDLVRDAVNDTGADPEDGVTNNSSPVFRGTIATDSNDLIEQGVTVIVEIDGTEYEAEVDAHGNWEVTAEGLADGEYTPIIRLVDLAGNVSEEDGPDIVIDTVTDEPEGALVHDEENDTGVDSEDGLTNNNKPTIEGTAEPLAHVRVELNGHVFEADAGDDGAWTVTVDVALPDGEYTPVITTTDLAGNEATAEGEAFTIVTTRLAADGISGGLVADEDNDTGASATDGLTNNDAPTLSGHAGANALVLVEVDGTPYEAEADGDGYWEVVLDTLADGSYTPIITVTDAAGNQSLPVNGKTFVVDTEAPAAANGALVHDATNDTGFSINDGITSNITPTFSGTAQAGSSVQVNINDELYNTTADAQGHWSVKVTNALSDDTYTPVFTVSDQAGNVSETEGPSFTIDTEAPVAEDESASLAPDEINDTGAASDDGLTNNSAPTLVGTAEEGAQVHVVVGGLSFQTLADANGDWQIKLNTLPDGQYTPVITLVDAAGHTSEPANGLPFTIDTHAPDHATAHLVHDEDSDTGSSADDGLTNNTSPTLQGTAEAGATVSVEIDGSSYEAEVDEDGNWEITAEDLSEGEHTPLVTVTDLAGNVSKAFSGESFTVITSSLSDATAELAHDEGNDTGAQPDDNITSNSSPLIEGTGEPGTSVRVDLDGNVFEADVQDDGTWQIVADGLSDGDYVPLITVIDRAGNQGDEIEGTPFTIDTEAPSGDDASSALTADEENDTGAAQDDGVTANNAPILVGTAEAGATVHVEVDGTVYEALVDDGGNWEIGLDALADGEYTPSITVIDLAGNESDAVDGQTFVIDTEVPSDASAELVHDEENDTGSDAEDNITNNTSPTLSGTTDALAKVTLEIDGSTYEAEADEDGNWEITVDDLSDGEHTPIITVVDLAGNVSDPMEGTPFTVVTAVALDLATAELVHDEENDTGAYSDDGITNNSSPLIEGEATPGVLVRVDIDGNIFETEAAEDGTWSVVADGLSDGEYTPIITLVDLAGNEGEPIEGIPFTIDTEAPSGDDASSALTADEENDTGAAQDDGVTANNAPILVGTAEAGATVHVEVDGTVYEALVDEDGNWEIGLDALADGEYTPSITVTDLAGNESDAADGQTIVIDTEAPSDATAELVHDEDNDTGPDAEDNITNNTAPTLSGATEALAKVSVEVDGTTYETEADEDGNWEVSLDGLSDGEHTPMITITDLAGNVSEPLEGTAFTVDSQAPTAAVGGMVHDAENDTGALTTDGLTSNDSPTLHGTAEAGSTVRVDIGGNLYETEVGMDGQWEVVADGLSDDTYIPLITVVDLAGNESEPFEGEPFTVDTEAPDSGNNTAQIASDATNDTGAAQDDFITANKSPLLTGTADGSTMVRVEVAGHVYQTVADEDGNWSVKLNSLPDGQYTPLISAIDAAGNVGDEAEGETFVVDTHVPTALEVSGGLTADEDNDTGASSTDGITNNNAPSLSGVVEALATLRVVVGGKTYETTAEDDGTWTVSLDDLADGRYTPTLTVTDAAGNVSAPIAGTSFLVDTLAPARGMGGLSPLSDSGLDNEDGFTAVTKPTIVGDAPAGSALRVTVGDSDYNTVADAHGHWSITVTQVLDDGEYTPTIVVMDAAGNETESEGKTFTIDTTGPEIDTPAGLAQDEEFDTGLNSDDGITSNTLPLVVGVAEPGSFVVMKLAGKTYTTVADDSGEWSVQITDELDDGTYVPSVLYVDDSGNRVQESGTPIVIDTEAPSDATVDLTHDEENDTGESNDDGITGNNSPLLQGTAEPGSHVIVNLNGNEYEADADETGAWELTADGLDDGEYTPIITLVDLAGNVSDPIEGSTFVVITEQPEEAVGDIVHDEESDTGLDPEDGITANNTPTLSGTAQPGAKLIINLNGDEFETTVGDDGGWELTVDTPLDDGQYTPVFTVIDVAGNVTESEGMSFTIDTEAPDSSSVIGGLLHTADNDSGSSSSDGITNVSAPTISGVADALALVQVEVDGTVYETNADEDGHWSVDLDELSDGEYVPLITIVDTAGNQSEVIEGEMFTILTAGSGDASGDLVHDAINDTGLDQQDGITKNSHPTLTGTADAGALVQIEIDDKTYQTQADDQGEWKFTVPDALADGEYIPLVSTTDLAGNLSEPLECAAIIIDTHVELANGGGLTHDETSDTGSSTEDGITNNRTPSLSGSAEADSLVRVALGALVFETTADADGVWTLDVDSELINGIYTPSIEVTDVAGNKAVYVGEAFTLQAVVETEGVNVGNHAIAIKGHATLIDLFGGAGAGTFEDYGGGLPAGLVLNEETGVLTGTATEPGWTWIANTTQDVAGNESISYSQLVVTTGEKTISKQGYLSINNVDEEKPMTYLGSSAADRISVYTSVSDVILGLDGNDTFTMYNQRKESDSPSMQFARVDGGAGIDTMRIYGAGMSMDYSDYNNPDGAGRVLEHVEVVQYADKEVDVTISASDVFHMKSDLFDVDGIHQLVRFMGTSVNGGTVSLDGLTQVGKIDQFGAGGGASNGKSADKFTKFVGVYTDLSGDHQVELLLQHGLTAA
jgi:hypothetical protein